MTEEVEEVNEIEVVARKHGWVPEEEYSGDPTNWVDADKWEGRSKRERLQAKQIGELERAISQSGEVLARLEAREKTMQATAEQTALEKLKAEMQTAVVDGDAEKAEAAAEAFAKQAEQKPAEQYTSAADFAVRDTFIQKNPIYQRQDIATSAASISTGIINRSPGLPIQQVLDQTHEEIQKIYPEHFVNKDRQKPLAVEGEGQRGSPPKGVAPEFKKAMNDYADNQVVYGMYKPKDGESINDAKKRARAGYENSRELLGLGQ